MAATRQRAGAEAIEFALILPIFVVLVIGIMEYSWAYFVRSTVVNAVRDGCRAGAVIPQDQNPTQVAQDSMEEIMAHWGTDCNSGQVNCIFDITTAGASPETNLQCQITVTYESIFNLIPVPRQLSAQSTVLFELQ